jgi:hypothetical protein
LDIGRFRAGFTRKSPSGKTLPLGLDQVINAGG